MAEALSHAWSETVRVAPSALALVQGATGKRWTRTELDEAAALWAEANGAGVARRIVVFSETNGPEWLTVFLGLSKAGAIIAPLDPGEPVEAQRRIGTSIGAAALWSGGRLEPLERRRGARSPKGAALIKLTSGTTGIPRPLFFTDAQILADGRQVCAGMNISPSDINYGLIPFGHSYGIGNLVMPLLAQGSPLVCASAALPHAIAADVAQFNATVFPAVPALLRAMVDSAVDAEQLRTLHTVISAGAFLPAEIASAFRHRFGRNVHSFYGSTETGGITYDRSGDAAASGRSVGTPLPGVTLSFHRGQRVGVTSAAVYTLGNRARFGLKGFHRTADIGELNATGELVLLGRAGRTIKIAGRRLNLAEVENALRQLPGVSDAMAMPHPVRADTLAAIVATTRPAPELRDALRQTLPSWKIPRKWVTVAAFPLTARGKTDARKLRAMLGEDRNAEG